jgi:hypothetical protein
MILLLAMLMAEAPPGPYRDAEITIVSTKPTNELVPCITRTISRFGAVTVIPVEGGSTVDFTPRSLVFGAQGSAVVSVKVVDAEESRRITTSYRHPFSVKAAKNFTRDVAKRCFPEEWASQAAN